MTRKKKESYLLDAGLMKIVDGEIMLSSEAIAILSDTRPEEWEEIAKTHGTDDFVEILYAKAVR